MKTPEIINGKVVKRWFSRGKARIPVFEDGTIGVPNKASDIKRNDYHNLKSLAKNDKTNDFEMTDKEFNEAFKVPATYSEEDKSASKMIDYNAKTRAERYRNYNIETSKELDIKNMNNQELRDMSKGWAVYKDTDSSNKKEVAEDKRLAKQELERRKAEVERFKERKDKTTEIIKDYNGVPIDQNWAKEQYSGMSYEDIKRNNDWEKEHRFEGLNPEYKPMWEARIRETDKYLENMPKYESRISDDFGTKDWDSGYPLAQNAWKGTKSESGLHGKDKIKAIDDEIKKAYPGIKTSRTTGRGGYTDSFSYSVIESDEPVIRNIEDFSQTELNRLYNKGYNSNYYKSVAEYKESLKKDLESGYLDINQYNINEDHRLTPYGKQLFKDIMKVSDAYNFDESDGMTDYFHTGHYLHLHVGKSGKPYKITSKNETINNFKRRKGK